MAEWQIEPLADDHDRAAFACGNAALDVFLRTQAGQYSRKGVGRTFVAVRPPGRAVIGYYTLAASSIEFQNFPKSLSKRLPKHPVPMILLALVTQLGLAMTTPGALSPVRAKPIAMRWSWYVSTTAGVTGRG